MRWIWVSHAQRLYGDDMQYDNPSSLTTHIQHQFIDRLHWEWSRALGKRYRHAVSNKSSQVRFTDRWGAVVTFNQEGKGLVITLPNNKSQ